MGGGVRGRHAGVRGRLCRFRTRLYCGLHGLPGLQGMDRSVKSFESCIDIWSAFDQ